MKEFFVSMSISMDLSSSKVLAGIRDGFWGLMPLDVAKTGAFTGFAETSANFKTISL
jgi:hypothetical protein